MSNRYNKNISNLPPRPSPEDLAKTEVEVEKFMQKQRAVPLSKRNIIVSDKFDDSIVEPNKASEDIASISSQSKSKRPNMS